MYHETHAIPSSERSELLENFGNFRNSKSSGDETPRQTPKAPGESANQLMNEPPPNCERWYLKALFKVAGGRPVVFPECSETCHKSCVERHWPRTLFPEAGTLISGCNPSKMLQNADGFETTLKLQRIKSAASCMLRFNTSNVVVGPWCWCRPWLCFNFCVKVTIGVMAHHFPATLEASQAVALVQV